MNTIKYLVYSGDGSDNLLAWFDEEVEAIAFAKENVGEQTRVEKAECDLAEDGFLNEIIDSKTIWSYLDNNVNEFDQEFPEEEPDEFDTEFPESDINDFNGSDDEDFGDYAWEDDNKLMQGFSMREAVNALEENESEVECKCCFELFPKEDCIKTEKGYLCKKCNQELHSHQGTNLDLIDSDPFSLDYEDPRDPEEEEEPEVKEEPVDANEIRKHEAGIEETLEEHVNDRPADIESDQKLQGVDNAVVDCKKYTLVAHSEDEKPVDCKLEKPALEEPLAGEEIDAKLYEDVEFALNENIFGAIKRSVGKAFKTGLGAIKKVFTFTEKDKQLDEYVKNILHKKYELSARNNAQGDEFSKQEQDFEKLFDAKAKAKDLSNKNIDTKITIADIEGNEIVLVVYRDKKIIKDNIDKFLDTIKLVAKKEEASEESESKPEDDAPKADVAPAESEKTSEETTTEEAPKAATKLKAEDAKAALDATYPGKDMSVRNALSMMKKAGLVEDLSEEEAKELDKEIETLEEELKVIVDFSDYKPWSGAIDTYELIKDADKLDELEAYLEECYPDGITATQINDILWFDGDQVLSYLGLGDAEDEEVDECLKEEVNEKPYILQQGENGEPEYIGFAKSKDDALKLVDPDIVTENTYVSELDNKDIYLGLKPEIDEEDIKKLDKYFGLAEELVEAKKDDELPVDPEAAKLQVHTMLNDLVADEIEAINGYEEAKKEILDTPIAHKDNILDTIDHVEDEEKEHVDELISATTEIPFDKEEAPAPAVEEPVVEEPLDQDFPEVEEDLKEAAPDTPFDSDIKEGDKIRIIHLEGEDNSYDGKEGTIDHIDSLGQLHGTWGGLAVIPGVDDFDIITEECLKEAKAKPEADKEKAYDDGLKLAKVYNKPVIYGYSNKSYSGKFFALPDPIICDSVFDETKKFKAQYKSCGTVYVAYPDKDFDESCKLSEDLTNQEIFTPEEQEEYNCDEDGNCLDSYDTLHHCGWCGDVYTEDEMRHEADFGWLCDRCIAELKSHGGPLTFIENENLEEASSAETKAFKNGGQDAKDYIQGKAIARIRDPKARAAAVAAAKAGRPDAVKDFIGDRKEDQAAAAYEKKAQAMADAGVKDKE